jgi:hypothetical protein
MYPLGQKDGFKPKIIEYSEWPRWNRDEETSLERQSDAEHSFLCDWVGLTLQREYDVNNPESSRMNGF